MEYVVTGGGLLVVIPGGWWVCPEIKSGTGSVSMEDDGEAGGLEMGRSGKGSVSME